MKITAMFWGLYSMPLVFSISQQSKDKQDLHDAGKLQTDQGSNAHDVSMDWPSQLSADSLKDTEVHTANIHPQQQPLMPLALNDDAGSRSLGFRSIWKDYAPQSAKGFQPIWKDYAPQSAKRFPKFDDSKKRFPEYDDSKKGFRPIWKDYAPQSPKKSEKITYKFKGTMELQEHSSKSVADSYYEKKFPKFDDSKKRFPEFDDSKKRFPEFDDSKKGFRPIWKDYAPQSPKGFPSKLKNREINYVPYKSPKNLFSPQPAEVYIPEEQDEELNDEIDRTDDFLNDYKNNEDNDFF